MIAQSSEEKENLSFVILSDRLEFLISNVKSEKKLFEKNFMNSKFFGSSNF